MKTKLFTLFFALAANAGTLFASVKVDDLYFNLDATSQTAEVTYEKWMTNSNYLGLKIANIPSSVVYNSVTYSVTSIGNEAFKDCFGLKEVYIPNSVIRIGDKAFSGCTGLEIANIGISVTSIGITAFNKCSSLESVIIPHGVTSINDNTFSGCSSLTSVTIPDGVTSIGNYAFSSCSSLTSVDIPENVTSLGGCAFYNCSGLTDIDIPRELTSIPSDLFYGCSKLTHITIPDKVTSIEMEAFRNCSALTCITIPGNVTTLADYAFYGCTGLTAIACKATTPPTCGSGCFYNVKTSIPLYVPKGTVAAYKAATGWKSFTNRKELQEEKTVSELEPVKTVPGTETAITFTLGGPSSSAVLLNLQAKDSYDGQKNCVVLRSTLEDAIVAQLMDNILQNVGDFESVFSGVSFFLPAGSGEVKLDICTFGLQLSVHIGNSGVAHLTQNERGEAVVKYDILEPTLVCIHASVSEADSPARLSAPKQAKQQGQYLELYGIKILADETPTGIDQTNGQQPTANSRKILRDGQLFILRDGKTFTLQGQEVR